MLSPNEVAKLAYLAGNYSLDSSRYPMSALSKLLPNTYWDFSKLALESEIEKYIDTFDETEIVFCAVGMARTMQGSQSCWIKLENIITYYLETHCYQRKLNHFNLCQLAQVLSLRESKDKIWWMLEA